MRIGILYMHVGPTGKIYIGKTWQPKGERFNGNWARQYTKSMAADALCYGREAFETIELYRIESDDPAFDDQQLAMLEIMAIEFFNSRTPLGYNIARGGGRAPSAPEAYAKISGEGNPMFGRKHTKRIVKQMTEARRAENLSEERRAAMREANKLRPRNAHGHYIKQGADYHPNTLKRRGIKPLTIQPGV